MPTVLTDYTSYAEVRAALGTNVDEVDDATLGLDVYLLGLEADLANAGVLAVVGSDLVADYATAAAKPTPTALETALVSAVKLFAPYSVAMILASGLPVFSPKSITGEKIGFIRQTDSYKEAVAQCMTLFSRRLAALQVAYGNYKNKVLNLVPRTYFAVGQPSTDPVTG